MTSTPAAYKPNKREMAFREKNKTVPIYKGAWNDTRTKLRVWLTDGTSVTLNGEYLDVYPENFKWSTHAK